MFDKVTKPMYDVMGPTTTFEWSENHHKAFDVLTIKLTEAPVFAYPT